MRVISIKVGELETNCYLVISGDEMIVVDPGAETKKILEAIKSYKSKVKYIINTHNHFDHVGANREVSEKTGAEISSNLKDGDEVKIGSESLKVISTPGHTKDSICLIGQDFIFTGDTLFKNGYGRTDLPSGSNEEMEKSLEKLSEIIKPGMLVYPGHGEYYKSK